MHSLSMKMDAKTNFIEIFCIWMLFHAAQAQEETKPTRLTGLGKNITTIPVALLDQCFPYESKTFGIEFRLPPTGGRCDDGLIICYPGSLATRTLDIAHTANGMSVNSELFNVDNAVNNSLGKYCAGLNVSWHGIKVHTEKSNGKVIMKLSTSLLEEEEQSFEIPDAERQFIIHFGNENEFSAYVTVDGERIELDVEKAELYKKLAPKGAHLKDFVGFWTLGLDMLPWMDHEVKLFVNRSCSCSIEAWFIRPTDGVPNDSKEPSTGIGGPKAKCIANIILKVRLNNSLKANRLIRIQMLINGNALDNSIRFAIQNANKTALMKFKVSTRQIATIHMKGTHTKNMTNIYLPKGNGTCHVDFIIALTNYSYGIVMNKKLLGGKEFFPAIWTKGLPFNDMTSLRLRGQFLLLTEPLVMPFEIFVGKEVLTLRVQPEKDQIVLQFNANGTPVENGTLILEGGAKLKAQKAYEFTLVMITNYQYKLKLGNFYFNRTATMPIWAINFVRIDGNITLLGRPEVEPPKQSTYNFSNFAIKLKTLLDYNDTIQLKLKNYGKAFRIFLLHDALRQNFEIGDVVLEMLFVFYRYNCTLHCSSLLSADKFENDVIVHAMNIMHRPAYKPRNFMQINSTNDLVQAGDLITVKLAIKDDLNDNSSVAINLFHEALEFNEKVGKTVMKVMLNADALYFSSSKPLINNSTNKQNCTNGKLDKELKELQIRVMDDGFNVTLTWNNDSSKTYTYNDGLPEWAVQYITYNNVTLSNPPNITCTPKERCIEPNNGREQYNIKEDSIWI